jgi:DNA-binding transcriptional MerR regulator
MPAVGRTPTDRGYLSIKEVLDVLVEEFPDITISKIRCLESRGLIHPERTPSGYRKFFEGDVDRLRWILRQQRENFLPLKVIKGRLDREHGGPIEPSLFDGELDGEESDSEFLATAADGRSVPAPQESESWTGESFPTESRTQRIAAPSLPRIVANDELADELRARDAVEDEGSPTPPAPLFAEATSASPRPSSVPGILVGDPAPSAVVEVTVATAPVEAAVPVAPTAPSARTRPAKSVSSAVAFSVGELCGASGAPPGLIAALEEFGLICSITVGGVRSYDEDALAIAHLASSFAEFGVEPRHLAVLKRAADRQGELYAQAVGPLMRQRNPAAREQAQARLDELVELGTTLQTVFVKASVRRQIGS